MKDASKGRHLTASTTVLRGIWPALTWHAIRLVTSRLSLLLLLEFGALFASTTASPQALANSVPKSTAIPESSREATRTARGQFANSKSGQTTTYTFNALHQLAAVSLPDGTRIDYAYGPDGNIASRCKTPRDGTKSTTHFLVDPTGPFPRIVAEYDDNGHPTATFIYGDELLARTKAGVETYYQHDGHGSVVLTEEDAAAIESSFLQIESQVSTGTLAGVLQGTNGLMLALRGILVGM